MNEIDSLLVEIEKAEERGDVHAALRACDRVIDLTDDLQLKFNAFLQRARAEAFGLKEPAKALDTYWEARHLTRRHHLGRAGEADLGIGMMLLDLERTNEGLEAIRRAVRYFRKAGNTFLRGCSETILADVAVQTGEDAQADRHLVLAHDLLMPADDSRMLSTVLTMRAGILARAGRRKEAEELLARARDRADQIHHAEIEAELRSQRQVIRQGIARSLHARDDAESS